MPIKYPSPLALETYLTTMAIFLLFVLISTLPSVPAQINTFATQWGTSVCQANTSNNCTGPKTSTECAQINTFATQWGASFCQANTPEKCTGPKTPNAQINIFAVQWGASVCQAKTPQKCTGTKTPTEFTIHGLWPPDDPTQTCSKSLPLAEISSLVDRLTKAWPNVYYYGVSNPTANYLKFWSEEWRKHGCFYYTLSAKAYFELALKIYKALGTLRQDLGADCHPGQPCNLQKALNAYDAKYPKRLPRIQCTVNRAGKEQIQEVRFKVSTAGEFEPLGGPNRTPGCTGATALFPNPQTSKYIWHLLFW